MSQGILSVTLQRDGPGTPWGFRLHGGKDIGSPLMIQRVFLGSPSEGELHRGDVILQVSNRDAGGLTHMEAHDTIKSAGNKLQLLVHRLPGALQSPAATPTSPAASIGTGHPLANVKAKSFQPMLPPKATPVQQAAQPWNRPTYSPVQPLPTSPIAASQPPFFTPTPQNIATAELLESIEEKNREKESIVSQGYRSVPLISPKPKARHDVPIGSYLRHVRDPAWKTKPSPAPAKSFVMSYQSTPTYARREPERIPMAGTNEGSQIVNLQYNTPLHIYSQEAVTQTIKEQTGLQPKPKQAPAAAAPMRNPAAAAPVNPSGPLSPNTTGGSQLAPAKPGTKLQNIVDITLSPTFQLLQEEEQRRSASPRPEPRTPPTMTRSPIAMAPRYEEERISPLGTPRDMIHQSGSFKSLMATLAMTGEGQEF